METSGKDHQMKIFYNGKLYKASPEKTAMVISEGCIKALGADEEILRSYGDEAEECVDLKGCLVLPGFTDSHMHLIQDALEKSYVDLSSARSFDDVRSLCISKVEDYRRSGQPLRGTGFNQNDWSVPKMPTRTDLDEIAPDIPVILQRTCHHITVCNTEALRLFDDAGRFPDGILREEEQELLEAALPPLTKERAKELIRRNALMAAAHGITAIHTDDLKILPGEKYGKTILEAYRELAAAGELPIRIVEQCNLSSEERLKAFLEADYRTGDSFGAAGAEGMFTIGPLKLLGDGALGARTAAMKDDYRDDPGNRGILNFDDDGLYSLCSIGHRNGMQIAIHGIGDRAIQQIIDTYRRVQAEYPREDARHGIVHCQITSAEQLRQIREQNILAYIQPAFLRADRYIAEDRVGRQLCSTSYDWRVMKDMGIHLCGGSDCPVESFDVLSGMYHAVARKSPGEGEGRQCGSEEGRQYGSEGARQYGSEEGRQCGSEDARQFGLGGCWHPKKALTVEEAIEIYTIENAYAAFAENTRGKLEPGYAADFCVLDRDITAMDGAVADVPMGAGALARAQVVMTVAAGKTVFSSPDM